MQPVYFDRNLSIKRGLHFRKLRTNYFSRSQNYLTSSFSSEIRITLTNAIRERKDRTVRRLSQSYRGSVPELFGCYQEPYLVFYKDWPEETLAFEDEDNHTKCQG